MKKLMIMAAAMAACVAFADAPDGGPAQRPEGGRRGMMGARPEGMMMMGDPIVRMLSNPKTAEALGLSEEQKTKLAELNKGPQNFREEQKKLRDATQKQLDLMKAEKVDESAVMAAIDEIFELRKAQAKAQAKRVIDVKAILTPEQVKKAHDEMQKAFAERGVRRNGPRDAGRRPADGGDKPGPKAEAEQK